MWSVSNTMDAEWCSQVLREALEKYPAPEIFNTDQGSQFTSEVFTQVLLSGQIRISMDGKGRALDDIFVERLWPVRRRGTVKYENVYLMAYADGWQLEAGLLAYFIFYNERRFHQSLNYRTPQQVLKGIEKRVRNQVENKIN